MNKAPVSCVVLVPRRRRVWRAAGMLVALASATLAMAPARAAPPAAAGDSKSDDVDLDRPLSTPPSSPTVESRKVAAELYNEGIAVAKRGNHKEAFRLFRASYEQDGSPEPLANMAYFEAKLGRPRAAAEHLARAIDKLPAEYANKVDDLKQRLAKIAKEVSVIRVHVESEGDVRIDGRWVGTGPLMQTVYVDPGAHAVRVQARGVLLERLVDLEKGDDRDLFVTAADVDALAKHEAAARAAKLATAAAAAPAAPPPDPKTPLLVTGVSLAVALAGMGAVGLGVQFRAAGERQKIDDDVSRFGGKCPASSPGFEDDCRARAQESGNETSGKVLAGLGLAGATAAGLGTLIYWLIPAGNSGIPGAARLQLVPMPGGVVMRGTF